MNFRPGTYIAAGQLCAVDFNAYGLADRREEVERIVSEKEFRVDDVNIIDLLRKQIGISKYKQNAIPLLAPDLANCRTIFHWAYGQKGIMLPQWFSNYGIPVSKKNVMEGDFVFVSDPVAPSGGHVAIMSGEKTVIHTNENINLIEESYSDFLGREGVKWRSIRRIILNPDDTRTFWCPHKYGVGCSEDILGIAGFRVGGGIRNHNSN